MLLVFMVLVVAFIVYMERAQRRIPVQYAKRVVGRRVYGGQSTYLPLRVNTGGVIPVIFASSVVMVPATIASMIQQPTGCRRIADYAAVGPADLLPALRRRRSSSSPTSTSRSSSTRPTSPRTCGSTAASSPASAPGKRTAEYIDRILTRITAGRRALPGGGVGAAGVPDHRLQGARASRGSARALDAVLPAWFTQGLGINFYFGGTSLLIVVGVAMDTIQQIESQLVMRNYEGFMKRGRIRGRRG